MVDKTMFCDVWISVSFVSTLMLDVFPSDNFTTEGVMRGSYWRGKDCDNVNGEMYAPFAVAFILDC